jgi:maltose phosphorylase
MAKVADRYLQLDPWMIIEEDWDAGKSLVSESVFSLGNEYMGVRGYFEEGYSGESLLGSYFNGVYEEEATEGSAYKGIVDKTHFMVNAVDWLYARVSFGGEALDLAFSRIARYRRALNLREGTLCRDFDWLLSGGRTIRVELLRFLDMEDPRQGFQRLSFRPFGFSGTLRLKIADDFNTVHVGRKKCLWKGLKSGFAEDSAGVMASTATTGQLLFSGFSWASNRELRSFSFESPRIAGYELELPLLSGEESFVEKKVCNLVAKDAQADPHELWRRGMEAVALQKARSFADAREDQERYWRAFWERFDIRIDGDEPNQQGIRYCLFQMQQTYHGWDAANNIGAKGLTGEAYNGHAFWDTETYCLPFYLFTNPRAAKNLLEFRYTTLPQARERAAMLDCRGACYPVATLNGEEACNLWQHASLQFQPSTAVAYGIAHYARISGDREFLYGHGAEMLVEISRFLASRGSWSQDGEDFGFYAVMGPDEFHMMVSNNCYTNYMAKKSFEFTLETLEVMRRESPSSYASLVAETGLSEPELQNLARCAQKMIINYDERTRLYEQHEGYFGLPHIDVDSISTSDFPLYSHWSYDRIYRTDMIKQPDVLMFMFLYGHEFPLETKRANYEYYEPRCIHESSLSPSVHSILASELGKHGEAAGFFGFATRMDLDNYNRNSGEGLHTTSIAAAWMNIVYGFGGMRSDGKSLAFSPSLPAGWKGYSLSVFYKGARIGLAVSEDEVSLRILEGQGPEFELSVYGEARRLGRGGLTLALPACMKG